MTCVAELHGSVIRMPSSILSDIGKFHHARVAAHNRVRQTLFKLLQKYALADWKLVGETPMYLTGLRLQEVPTAEVQQAGRVVQDSQIQRGQMSLGSSAAAGNLI